jgi:hypothetical protein
MPQPAPTPPPRQRSRGREFLAEHPVQATTIAGAPALLVAVRLPSYRSLPLSCLDAVTLRIDGAEVAADRIEFLLDGHVHRLDALAGLPHLWWFVLDLAQLRVRLTEPAAASAVHLEAELVTVEPYISNGRFHFSYRSARTLAVVDGPREGIFRA